MKIVFHNGKKLQDVEEMHVYPMGEMFIWFEFILS